MGVGVADSFCLGWPYLIIGSYQSGIKQRRSKEKLLQLPASKARKHVAAEYGSWKIIKTVRSLCN